MFTQHKLALALGAAALTASLSFAPAAAANAVKLNYQVPAQAIVDIVDAAPSPSAALSPNSEYLLTLSFPSLPSIEDLAADELKLAGRRINPANYSVSQARYISAISILEVESGTTKTIAGLPSELKAIGASWSPNSDYLAVAQLTPSAVELWLIDVAAGRAEEWTDLPLSAVWGAELEWRHDSKGLYTYTVPDGLTKPAARVVPTGPVITESKGRTAPARTYQDLLKNKHDEALFDYYFTSRITYVELDGDSEHLGNAAIYSGLSIAPNDEYLLTSRIERPYSYAVPYYRFPETTEVWDTDGDLVYSVVEQPLADNLPIAFDAVVQGRRSVQWRNDADATLVWAEAADQGDPAVAAEIRDRVFQLPAPFKGKPVQLAELSKRFGRLLAADAEHILIWERWWADRDEKLWLVDASGKPSQTLVWERSWEDRYNDPGQPFTVTEDGRTLLHLDEGAMLLSGNGASAEGDRPFIDRYDLTTKQAERLWRSEAPYYEAPRDLIDAEALTFLTQREGVDDPADFFVRDIDDNELQALTDTPHPMPHTLGITRELITYEREDGLAMSAELYLPAGYNAETDGPLPTIVWAYPREYKSAAAAG